MGALWGKGSSYGHVTFEVTACLHQGYLLVQLLNMLDMLYVRNMCNDV